MRRKLVHGFFLLLIMIGVFSACFGEEQKTPIGERIKMLKIPAPSLQNNLLKELDQQICYIYLPPSYPISDKKYPVVYFFNGYTAPYMINASLGMKLDELIEKGKIREFILISVKGVNRLGGSFLVNSPVTGNWEDYAVCDVINFVDTNYRTIAKSSARGIAGFSMGGFAAINLAFRHPDLYSVVYALGPGLFDPDGLENAMGTWDLNFKKAYGAAFAPQPEAPYPHAGILELSGTPEDNAIREKWENGFGNLSAKIDAYLKKKERLTAIRIHYGKNDYYKWIPEGCVYFSKLLTEVKIKHDLIKTDGGHDWNPDLFAEYMFPFFSENFSYK